MSRIWQPPGKQVQPDVIQTCQNIHISWISSTAPTHMDKWAVRVHQRRHLLKDEQALLAPKGDNSGHHSRSKAEPAKTPYATPTPESKSHAKALHKGHTKGVFSHDFRHHMGFTTDA